VWLRSSPARAAFLDALAVAWRGDLERDGTAPDVIERRIARSDAIVREAPVLLAAFVSLEAADEYGDGRRRTAERDMFVAAAGAAIQNVMVALAAQSVGSAWISSSMFCSGDAAGALGLPAGEWLATGCVAAGYAAPGAEPPPRSLGDVSRFLDVR
jgi:coenzyme F420-0:L-glutamate ligase/coenzyme F420-1:gamma-L-glutamate ligase